MPTEESTLDELFQSIDANNDGFITFEEFKLNLMANMNLRESIAEQKPLTNELNPTKIQQLKEIAALVIDKSNRTITLNNVKNCI